MKKSVLFLVLILIWIGCDAMPENSYNQPTPVLTAAEMRASDHRNIHLTFSHEMAAAIPAGTAGFVLVNGTNTNTDYSVLKTGPSNYALRMTNMLYHTNSFTLSFQSESNRIISIAGGVLESFSNVNIVNSLVAVPVLWNTLGSADEVENSRIGTNLVLRNGTHSWGAGYFGNGFLSPEGSLYGNGAYIPANTIPKTDVTVEFWYVRTGSFVSNEHLKLLGGTDTAPDYKTSFSISLCRDMYYNSIQYGSVIQTTMRIHSSAAYEVRGYHSYGHVTNLEAAFPLNTPVHVAVTKQNSDGALAIYVDGVALTPSYMNNEPDVTPNTSYLAGETGTFNFKLGIGNNFQSEFTSEPAKGVIDNIKVYGVVKTNFADRFQEGYIF